MSARPTAWARPRLAVRASVAEGTTQAHRNGSVRHRAAWIALERMRLSLARCRLDMMWGSRDVSPLSADQWPRALTASGKGAAALVRHGMRRRIT